LPSPSSSPLPLPQLNKIQDFVVPATFAPQRTQRVAAGLPPIGPSGNDPSHYPAASPRKLL
ncbi:MAG TPA: hypothetical protein VLT36_25780, partial [Candidatus Dormibacteraeota bacterium]|nr:hypothetical protein [Candidatus Dormibacteraeota bacterium]